MFIQSNDGFQHSTQNELHSELHSESAIQEIPMTKQDLTMQR